MLGAKETINYSKRNKLFYNNTRGYIQMFPDWADNET